MALGQAWRENGGCRLRARGNKAGCPHSATWCSRLAEGSDGVGSQWDKNQTTNKKSKKLNFLN